MLCQTLGSVWLAVTATLYKRVSNFRRLSLPCQLGLHLSQDFVGYWPSKDTVVVAHEGTDPTQL